MELTYRCIGKSECRDEDASDHVAGGFLLVCIIQTLLNSSGHGKLCNWRNWLRYTIVAGSFPSHNDTVGRTELDISPLFINPSYGDCLPNFQTQLCWDWHEIHSWRFCRVYKLNTAHATHSSLLRCCLSSPLSHANGSLRRIFISLLDFLHLVQEHWNTRSCNFLFTWFRRIKKRVLVKCLFWTKAVASRSSVNSKTMISKDANRYLPNTNLSNLINHDTELGLSLNQTMI